MMTNIPHTNALNRLLGARDMKNAAQREYEARLQHTFKCGVRVAWKHGDTWRHGVVKNVVGTRIQIEPETGGAWYWVKADRILDAMADAQNQRNRF